MRFNPLNIFSLKKPKEILVTKKEVKKVISSLPNGRITTPPQSLNNYLNQLSGIANLVKSDYMETYVPLIRKLVKVNPDAGLALNDMVQLCNTGFKVKFDKSVDDSLIDKMRIHLNNKMKEWGDGVANMDGLINKMVSQLWIAGALSNEWVPRDNLSGISNVVMVNPETIFFKFDERKKRYIPYQKQYNKDGLEKYVKLNTKTFKYYALNGDEENPYPTPPYLTALEPIDSQLEMNKNIRYIMKQLGILGYFEALLAKPDQQENESVKAYQARLKSLLTETKTNLQDGLNDGIIVGYSGDHEFSFHSTTAQMQGVGDIYNLNETQIANGLKTPPPFIGSQVGKTETSITVVFTKMLSQLKNVQNIVKANLEHGFTLELLMAGYTFNNLTVEFNPSTISDDLKIQQALEIKIRNYSKLYADGIISMETYADALGFEEPDQDEPRVPLVEVDVTDPTAKAEKREKDKDKSDRKKRQGSKPVPPNRDADGNK